MQDLNEQGRRLTEELSQRHGVSQDAVRTLLQALAPSHGAMAQFSHPDLGGMGQWARGGMVMIGDMFNQGLKARVDALCAELSDALRAGPLFASPTAGQVSGSGQAQFQGTGGMGGFGQGGGGQGGWSQGGFGAWWPAGLGQPSSSGAQNDLRYACFPDARRLAVEEDGRVTVYDTGEHRIGGVSQQQGGGRSLSFTSQHGPVRLEDLPVVRTDAPSAADQGPAASSEPPPPSPAPASAPASSGPAPSGASTGDPIARIEQLAELHRKGILTEEEFSTAKAELLRRL